MQQIKEWIDNLGYKSYNLEEIKADASFRKYYRLTVANESFILMDSSLDILSYASKYFIKNFLLKYSRPVLLGNFNKK